MKNLFFFLMLINGALFAQSAGTIWKPLPSEDNQKYWYDASMIDTVTQNTFDVTVLQMHKPPLEIEELSTPVYRSITTYTVNMSTVKYGIVKVSYFDSANKEIGTYNYSTKLYNDQVKYSYPITSKSPLLAIIKEYFNNKEKGSK